MRRSRPLGPAALAVWLLLAAIGGLLACGESREVDGEHREPPRETVDRPVLRVDDPGASWDRPRRLELVREVPGRALVRAGEEPAKRGLSAAEIRDLSPADDGRLLVLDGDRARVTVLGNDGRLVRRLGRAGQGPGELGSPGRVEPGADGGVRVLERRPPTVHRWDSTGGFEGRRRLRLDTASTVEGIAEWGARLPEGRAVRLVALDPGDPSAGRSAVYVTDTTGRLGSAVVSWRRKGTRARLPEVFGARRSWAAAVAGDGRGRIVVTRGDRYELRRYDLSGRLDAVVRRDVERIRVSDRLRRRALDRFVEEARRGGAPEGVANRLRERLPVADRLPAIAETWSSPGGRIWVGIPGEGERGGPPPVVRAYDVFGPDLAYLGRVSNPRGFRLHRVRGDRLYGTWRDELGVPGVRVYRLRRSIQP